MTAHRKKKPAPPQARESAAYIPFDLPLFDDGSGQGSADPHGLEEAAPRLPESDDPWAREAGDPSPQFPGTRSAAAPDDLFPFDMPPERQPGEEPPPLTNTDDTFDPYADEFPVAVPAGRGAVPASRGAPSASDPAPTPPARQGSISERAMAARAPARPADTRYLDGLNPEQRLAVESLDGPVLVLAGAGTGKTRVLTTRIAHILASRRAYPSQILAVTFTNKAAREMKARVGRYVGGEAEGMPWLGTFHSICVKILRRHAELVGLRQGFTILDMDDSLRLMKQVIEAAGVDKERWPARQLAALIDAWKNKGLTPDKVPAGESHAFAAGKGRELYAAYQKRLKELNAVDFGDLLLETLRLFLENPDILADYQRRFRFILVDEYQDTNVVQYLWLRLLAQGSPNLCCVGDDDQSIYGWRGAEVDNILRFETDFPGATVIRLERNYRSTSNILAAASHLIAENKGRLGKTLFTDGSAGDKVTVTGVWDDEEEARSVVSEIEAQQKTGHKLNEIAILVRASFQMRALEDRFITTGLPYRVIGGPRFYERQEIKDAIAYLEVTVNPANDLKFERIINVPKRGIGETTVKRIRELGSARETPMFAVARMMIEADELAGKTRAALAGLIRNFEMWRRRLDEVRHTELAEQILDESGYTAMWQADKSPQAAARLDNLKELVRFMHEFDTMAGFLEHVSLVMDTDAGNDGDRVSLMTLHAAKGLEFDTVFLTGWEEGVFPSQRTLDESGAAGLEEERRLAYVGLTRAKQRAHVSFAQNRRNRGLYQSAVPSRFVDELPEAHVEVIETKSPFGGAYQNFQTFGAFGAKAPYGQSRFDTAGPSPLASTYDTPGWKRAERQREAEPQLRQTSKFYGDAGNRGARPKPPKTIEGELIASSTSPSVYKTGERVFHQKFGYGRIAEVEGNKLTVDFDKSGRKKVVDSFVERG